jgi:hypothetical protein
MNSESGYKPEDNPETPSPLPPPLPVDAGRAVARRPVTGIEAADGEPLPVLEAFQEFLDAERRRSRNRMIALSAAFAGVLAIVIAVGLCVALNMLRPVHAEFVSLQNDINSSKQRALRAARRAEDALGETARKDRQLREQMARDRQALSESQFGLKQQADAVQSEVARTREILKILQAENLQLKAAVRDRPQVARAPAATPAGDATSAAAAVAPNGQPAAAARPSPSALRTHRALDLAITPIGGETAIPWRITVPE